jgi:hypothetical protein
VADFSTLQYPEMEDDMIKSFPVSPAPPEALLLAASALALERAKKERLALPICIIVLA